MTGFGGVIIGDGHRGLVCAGYPARSGLSVALFKRAPKPDDRPSQDPPETFRHPAAEFEPGAEPPLTAGRRPRDVDGHPAGPVSTVSGRHSAGVVAGEATPTTRWTPVPTRRRSE